MMRGEERSVNIFNMSFLDVLCCTVGALIFILFIQTLRTRDMVERQELEKTVTKLDEAKAELVKTEKAEEQLQLKFRQLQENFLDVQFRDPLAVLIVQYRNQQSSTQRYRLKWRIIELNRRILEAQRIWAQFAPPEAWEHES